MTTQRPATLQHSDLIGRLVLDRSTADEVGRVDQLWLNPSSQQILGFTCKSGLLGHKRRSFHWSQIESLGGDGILVQSAAVEPAQPDTVEAVIGHEVWTDVGNRAGLLKDYQISFASGQVLSYLFVSNGWRGILDGIYALSPHAILSIGPKRIIVIDSAIQQAQLFEEGLTQKVTHAAAHLKDDYAKTRQEFTTVVQDTQAIASNFQHTTQQATQQAAQQATARAKETLGDLQSTTRQATRQATAQAKQKLSGLVGQLQDKTQQVTHQVTQQGQAKIAEVKTRLQNKSEAPGHSDRPPDTAEQWEDDPLEDWE